jgi:hypothetical protein
MRLPAILMECFRGRLAVASTTSQAGLWRIMSYIIIATSTTQLCQNFQKSYNDNKRDNIMTKISLKTRKIINEINLAYHTNIPLKEIFDAVELSGLTVVDEDGEPWNGILCGNVNRAIFSLKNICNKIVKPMLVVSWYKMPITGKYEVTVYFS